MTKRLFLIIILLVATIFICFALPKPKYESLNIFSILKIPYAINSWQGKDIAKELDLNDDRYRFISEVFGRIYTNESKESLLLLILDAGNFHNPKVCFGSSGYKIKELTDTEFDIQGSKFKAPTLYVQKGDEGFLLVYWMCIDKKMAGWTEQKIKELWSSLFSKKKVGLMVRLDIPTKESNIKTSLVIAKKFVEDLDRTLLSEQAGYIFGKKK